MVKVERGEGYISFSNNVQRINLWNNWKYFKYGRHVCLVYVNLCFNPVVITLSFLNFSLDIKVTETFK